MVFSEADVVRMVVRACEQEGDIAFATRAGVSRQYVYDVRRGNRAPGPKILRALGLRKTWRYERLK